MIIDALTKRGILIDWDLARFQCELASGPTEPDRTVRGLQYLIYVRL